MLGSSEMTAGRDTRSGRATKESRCLHFASPRCHHFASRRAEFWGEVAAADYFDLFEIQPCGDRVELVHQRFGDCGWADAGFAVRSADEEGARSAIGFQINARDQTIAQQERQNVVAELAIRRWRVDFDAVVEAEDSFGARTIPDQRVEGREQGARVDFARRARIARDVGRGLPTFDCDREQISRLDQFLDARASGADAEAEVIAEIFFSADTESVGGDSHERSVSVFGRRCRQGEDADRNYALGEIVNALEAATS